MNPTIKLDSYKNLIVWQKAVDLVVEIYNLTETFPKSELYGLVSQMRRAVVSIPSNIAEGRRGGSKKEFRQFVVVAFGSGAELETQIEISKRLAFGELSNFSKAEALLSEVMRMLNRLVFSLSL
jgi:four helix bundle protein